MAQTTPFAPDSSLDEPSAWLALKDRALDVAAEGITIADARLPGRPLVYVNEGFVRMTGYPAAEAEGRNCRFLQGPDTDPAAAQEIRDALSANRPCVVEILNYRKDGSTFWNRLSITPVRSAAGDVTHLIGVQSDVTARRAAEDGLRRSKEALEHDLRLAARVQQALLPPREVRAGQLLLAHAFEPCDDLAGDAVGIVNLPDNRLGVYLLDVSGHGVGAALLSFTLSHLLSPTEGSLITDSSGRHVTSAPPSEVAARLNRQFPMDRTRQYFTLVYAVVDVAAGGFEYVVAGHPPPVLMPAGGRPAILAGGGLPVGMLDDATYESERLTLNPGDRVYFYTDGVIEAIDPAEQEFGLPRLLEEIGRWRDRPLSEGLARIVDAVRQWRGGPLADDVSMLAVELAP